MSWEIRQGDALERLREMPSESVQTCVTSPPYWGLRDYGDPEQLGLERSPAEYVARLVEVFSELRRVLRGDGTLWLNLGDSFAARASGRDQRAGGDGLGRPFEHRQPSRGPRHDSRPDGLKDKDLVGIPWRVAFALQDAGWWLRSDIIWAKPCPMPEPVTDRPTRSHEYLFLLAKSKRYFYDAAAIREADGGVASGNGYDRQGSRISLGTDGQTARWTPGTGRNRRDVWTIGPDRSARAARGHFAVFPSKLVEPCILAGAPVGAVVLDPFAGSGTSGVVAQRHGRDFVGIELSPAYVDLARQRIRDDAPLFNEAAERAPA